MGIKAEIAKRLFRTAGSAVAGFFASYGKIVLAAGVLITALWVAFKAVTYVQEAEEAKATVIRYRQDLKNAWAQTRRETLAVEQCTKINAENFLKARESEEAARRANERAIAIERNADRVIEVINREADEFMQGDSSCESITPAWLVSFVGWMRERP